MKNPNLPQPDPVKWIEAINKHLIPAYIKQGGKQKEGKGA